MDPTPLPEGLRDRPITPALARDAGVPVSRLTRGDLTTVTRGVHLPTTPETLQDRALAFSAAMPAEQHAFSHVTAAQLSRLALPSELEKQENLDVLWPTKRGRVRRDGCWGHRGLESRQVIRVAGVAVTDLADTWCDLGEVVRRGLARDDLVIVGDQIVTSLDPGRTGTGVSLLRARLEGRVRPRGKVLLSEALELVRPGSKSPMETRARLVFAGAGLPEPELNVAVMFESGGGWMLEGDFVWRRRRVIGEYQGVHHATIQQRGVDNTRRLLAEDEGWRFIEIFAADVFNPARRHVMLNRFAVALGVPAGELRLA